MYRAIEKLESCRNLLIKQLDAVYSGGGEIYKRQAELGKLAINIYSNVGDALIPVLREDGVDSTVWSKISLRLDKLSFVSLPNENELREKYRRSLQNPTAVSLNRRAPREGERIKSKRLKLPAFLAIIAAQGIVIPLILHLLGGTRFALVKIIIGANTACVMLEIIRYFDILPKLFGKTAEPSESELSELMTDAIREVWSDNRKRLNDWFDKLSAVTTEEIDRALKQDGKLDRAERDVT